MNNVWKKFRSGRRGRGVNLVITIVILIEVLVLLTVATYSWVETISSVKISTLDHPGTVNNHVYTDADIGEDGSPIDLAKYFKESGDIHLAPASSADGFNFYFPKNTMGATDGVYQYRKGNSSDKNTNYLSVSFRVNVTQATKFYFVGAPDFGVFNDDIRVSVISRDEGAEHDSGSSNIYSLSGNDQRVVNAEDGSTTLVNGNSFSSFTKTGGHSLFEVLAGTTKNVTINLWLQKRGDDGTGAIDNTDLTTEDNMDTGFTINNLGIISQFTPRKITLLPTPTWENVGTPNYYAWCWMSDNSIPSSLYHLELDPEEEHYSFKYNGAYDRTVFFISSRDNLTTETMDWTTLKEKTEDTKIPDTPENPTYIIKTQNGSSITDNDTGKKRSTGEWVTPSIVKVKYVTNQDSAFGSLTAKSYRSTTVSNANIIEQTNASSQEHTDTVHAWPGKKIQVTASANPGYRFVGWYTNAAGTVAASGTNTSLSYSANAPAANSEITYYAKFIRRYTLTIDKYVDGVQSTIQAGTITIDSNTCAASSDSHSMTVDDGASLEFSASANPGYTLQGIYTQPSGTTTASSPVSMTDSKHYYAQFTTNNYIVTANATYSDDNGATYSDGGNGGTVQVDSQTAGATSSKSVKYTTTATLKAVADSDYAFVGWYDADGNVLNANATYTYTLDSPEDVDVYARFKLNKFNVTANAMYSSDNDTYTAGATGGKVTAGSSTAGATSTAKVTYQSTVRLVASSTTDYAFVGWFDSSGTLLSGYATYDYPLSTYDNVNVFARFRLRKFTVTAKATYSTAADVDTYNEGSNGGTVRAGGSSYGATSAATVYYNNYVTLAANAGSDYQFIGWYDSDGTRLSTSASYSYKLEQYANTNVYARFKYKKFTVTAKSYYRTSTSGSYAEDTSASGGTVKVGSSAAGATSSGYALVGGTVQLKATPKEGYIFDGWYSSTSAISPISSTPSNASLGESFTYTLSDYSNATVYARFRKGDIFLTGYLDKGVVTDNLDKFKFTHTDTADVYQLTYEFTNNEGGSQYALFRDSSLSGNNVYHPTDINSGSNAPADLTKTDTLANDDPKWKIDATTYDIAVITWNNKTKTPTWTVSPAMKTYYFKVNACSWFGNDSCVPAVKYGDLTAYVPATLVDTDTGLYTVDMPKSVTTFSFGRHNSSGDYNARDVSTSGTNNCYTVSADNKGGTWSSYSP